jgi:hypothetical protein
MKLPQDITLFRRGRKATPDWFKKDDGPAFSRAVM